VVSSVTKPRVRTEFGGESRAGDARRLCRAAQIIETRPSGCQGQCEHTMLPSAPGVACCHERQGRLSRFPTDPGPNWPSKICVASFQRNEKATKPLFHQETGKCRVMSVDRYHISTTYGLDGDWRQPWLSAFGPDQRSRGLAPSERRLFTRSKKRIAGICVLHVPERGWSTGTSSRASVGSPETFCQSPSATCHTPGNQVKSLTCDFEVAVYLTRWSVMAIQVRAASGRRRLFH